MQDARDRAERDYRHREQRLAAAQRAADARFSTALARLTAEFEALLALQAITRKRAE